jgi:oligopeptide/dipeptide ABC transporter ATP-binding protein
VSLLALDDVHVHFATAAGLVRAVNGVSLELAVGETLGLVGESGCGKSTLGKAIVKLVPIAGGAIVVDGVDIAPLTGERLGEMRRKVQMIFQDPYGSLNPRSTVGRSVAQPLLVAGWKKEAAAERVDTLLGWVGLPADAKQRYPHEFSGGQRQRIGIARALALGPDLIFADEPVSALDVSVQAQILVLLEELRQRRRLAFVFISHDLGVVRHFCQRVAVMYLGRIVEEGPVPAIFEEPLHPYTRLLKASSPVPDPERAVAMNLQEGEPPSPVDPPPGCHFHPRCPFAMDRCRAIAPALQEVVDGRRVACHLFDQPDAAMLANGQEKPESSRISP